MNLRSFDKPPSQEPLTLRQQKLLDIFKLLLTDDVLRGINKGKPVVVDVAMGAAIEADIFPRLFPNATVYGNDVSNMANIRGQALQAKYKNYFFFNNADATTSEAYADIHGNPLKLDVAILRNPVLREDKTFISGVLQQISRHLKPSGTLLMTLTDEIDPKTIKPLLIANGFTGKVEFKYIPSAHRDTALLEGAILLVTK